MKFAAAASEKVEAKAAGSKRPEAPPPATLRMFWPDNAVAGLHPGAPGPGIQRHSVRGSQLSLQLAFRRGDRGECFQLDAHGRTSNPSNPGTSPMKSEKSRHFSLWRALLGFGGKKGSGTFFGNWAMVVGLLVRRLPEVTICGVRVKQKRFLTPFPFDAA